MSSGHLDNSKKSGYVLGRGYEASARLHHQHYMLHELIGYLVHPEVITSKEELRIADVGCGTGVWLSKLSKHLPPSAQLDGFDVSADQFLPQQYLASNIKLRTMNALEPVPLEYRGQYDVVHIGLFCLVLRSADDFAAVLQHVIGLLAPGGWVQWDELDLPGAKAISYVPGLPGTAAKEAVSRFFEGCAAAGFYWDWVQSLDTIFTKSGLTRSNLYRYPLTMDLAKPWTDNCLLVMEKLGQDMVNQATSDEERKKWSQFPQIIDMAHEESLKGVSIGQDFLVTIGQKQV